jgi:ribosomal subunit interface protein
VEIVVKARHTEVGDRFRACVHEKVGRLGKLDPRVDQLEVEVCEERNPRQSSGRIRVELTCRSRRPVIRAEAAAADALAALDLAVGKFDMRLRRAASRRRVHHGTRTPVSVATATSTLPADADAVDEQPAENDAPPPFVVRTKDHVAAPMTVDDALLEMELVGHDFFLFVNADDEVPSVVYRRHGYDYGLLRLRLPEK